MIKGYIIIYAARTSIELQDEGIELRVEQFSKSNYLLNNLKMIDGWWII